MVGYGILLCLVGCGLIENSCMRIHSICPFLLNVMILLLVMMDLAVSSSLFMGYNAV